jgi:hypothetical protein
MVCNSGEAEYVEILEVVKKIRFIHFLLIRMGVDIRCKNFDAIFMAENSSSGTSAQPRVAIIVDYTNKLA